MNILRMQMLSNYLRNYVKPENFTMGDFWYFRGDKNTLCGCTIGHAAHMPEFILLGFDWHQIKPQPSFNLDERTLEVEKVHNAFREFMGLNITQAESITDYDLILTPTQVADLIDKMIAQACDNLALPLRTITDIVIDALPSNYVRIPSWNDAKNRTKEEVIEFFEMRADVHASQLGIIPIPKPRPTVNVDWPKEISNNSQVWYEVCYEPATFKIAKPKKLESVAA